MTFSGQFYFLPDNGEVSTLRSVTFTLCMLGNFVCFLSLYKVISNDKSPLVEKKSELFFLSGYIGLDKQNF